MGIAPNDTINIVDELTDSTPFRSMRDAVQALDHAFDRHDLSAFMYAEAISYKVGHVYLWHVRLTTKELRTAYIEVIDGE